MSESLGSLSERDQASPADASDLNDYLQELEDTLNDVESLEDLSAIPSETNPNSCMCPHHSSDVSNNPLNGNSNPLNGKGNQLNGNGNGNPLNGCGALRTSPSRSAGANTDNTNQTLSSSCKGASSLTSDTNPVLPSIQSIYDVLSPHRASQSSFVRALNEGHFPYFSFFL